MNQELKVIVNPQLDFSEISQNDLLNVLMENKYMNRIRNSMSTRSTDLDLCLINFEGVLGTILSQN